MSAYLLILRRDQTKDLGLPEADLFQRFTQWIGSLHERGWLRAVERLKAAAEGMTVRSRRGAVVAEGPYDACAEAVIGFLLVDAPDPSAAREIADECPILVAGGSVEIREIEHFPKPQTVGE